MPDVSKVDVAGDFPSAFAGSYDERVLLGARQFLFFNMVRNAILTNQPFPRRRIDQSHADEAAVLPAELLEGSIRDECIDQLQLSI
jgi:hypothetical protein